MKTLVEGESFGEYSVVRRLGKGGMGEVWLLRAPSGTEVAAKILDAASSTDHESRKRFLREAELALGVKHPNLVETYDVGEDPDTGLCYILMEYMSGGTLADYLHEHGALPIEDAVAVVEAMAAVLELGRRKGIVHRDIKPANIMFDAEGTPKLADLGIARGGAAGTDTTTMTQTGAMIGTPAYMAPEQMLDAHNVDTRADIYSLGVVFFEMLTGERPNAGDTVVQLMAKAVKGEPLPDVRTLRPEISASLAQLLAMMVTPDKEGRISTPGQITSALKIIERGGRLMLRHRPSPANVRTETTDKRGPGVAAYVMAILAMVATTAVCTMVIRRYGQTPAPSAPAAAAVVREVVRTNVINAVQVHTNVVNRTVVETRVKEVTRGADDANGRGSASVGPVAAVGVGRPRVPKEGPDPRYKDFKVELLGVAVVDDIGAAWKQSGGFSPPETRLDVPYGKVAAFDIAYDFPVGYKARVWVRNYEAKDADGQHVGFGSNPSTLYEGKGRTRGFLLLSGKSSGCELKSVKVTTSTVPELDACKNGNGTLGTFPINLRFLPPGSNDLARLARQAKEKLSQQRAGKFSTPPGWLDDLNAAKAKAKRENKQILAAFEGSDWCGWCTKMEADVYSKAEFMPAVTDRFVVVYLDSPRNRNLLRPAVRELNPALHTEYKVNGVPCVMIMDANGVELGRVGGYKNSVGALMARVNAIPGVQPEKVMTAKGALDPEAFRDPDATRGTQKALDALFPEWTVSRVLQETNEDMRSGFHREHRGRANVVLIHSVDCETPAVLRRTVDLRKKRSPCLVIETASRAEDTDFLLSVRVNGKDVLPPRLICTPDSAPWERIQVPLSRWKGAKTAIEVVIVANNWFYEHAYLSKLEIVEGTGTETGGPVGIRSMPVFPRAELRSSKWKSRAPCAYTMREPPENWNAADFDDSKWKFTKKALGVGRGPDMAVAEVWRSDRIWIRRKFDWKGSGSVYKAVFDLYYDQDIQIYLNGTLVLDLNGWNKSWVPYAARTKAFASALRQGENVLAMTLKGDGESYFDCGLTIETDGR